MATLVGLFTLGRNAEVRNTSNGDPVASLALAYNYGRKGQDGKTPTQWVDASLWGERAQKLAEHLTKGRQFFMSVDDLHVETYQKNDGSQGVKLTGRVGQIEFTRGESAQQRQAPPQPQRQAPPQRQPAPAGSGFDDMPDDIPF